MQPEQSRFLRKVTYDPQTGCWLWVGAKYRFGYGHFRRKINGVWKMYKAHRYSYEFYKGIIPPKLCVLHHCDNSSCVNPDHLYTGTVKDNSDDMKKRNRRKFGRNPLHKLLNMDIVSKIRQYSLDFPKTKQIDISNIFGISTAQVSRILNNKIWKEN